MSKVNTIKEIHFIQFPFNYEIQLLILFPPNFLDFYLFEVIILSFPSLYYLLLMFKLCIVTFMLYVHVLQKLLSQYIFSCFVDILLRRLSFLKL